MELPISALRKTLMTLLVVSLFTVSALAQTVKVTGKVTDSKTGEGLPGVSVIVKGTQNGAATDINGAYSINAPKGASLEFSFVGYTTTTAKAEGATLNIRLVEASKTIDEVVVIGYGTVKKNDATGSVQAVSSKEFNRGAITSPQQLIAGKSAGVVVTQSSGAPGSGSQIRIRGGASLNASNDPLVVVDGVPLTSDGAPGQSNGLNSINPEDIESFTILKDASATAIYGSRASNGVILITTKKGSANSKFAISYNGSVNVNTVGKTLDVYNAADYKALVTGLAGKISGLSSSDLNKLGSANTDWQKEIYRTSYGHNQNVSVNGNVANMPFRLSYGYTNDEGILKNTDFNRHSVSGAFSPSFFDNHLKINLNARGTFSDYNYGNDGAIGNATVFDPTQPIKNGSVYGGYFTWLTEGKPNNISSTNPMALIDQTNNKASVKSFIGNFQVDYKFHFLPQLRANLNLGTEYTDSKSHNISPNEAAFTWRNGMGRFNEYSGTVKNDLLDFYLNYNNTFGVHNIDATLGYSWQRFWSKENKLEAQNDQKSGDRIVSLDRQNKGEHYIVSFFGRVNYSLKNKYLVTFTLRDDGSSRFSSKNRWGVFPAAALGWKISEEEFLKGTAVSDLKLRLGYGVTGQQEGIENYGYIPLWTISTSTAGYQFGNGFVNTFRPNRYNPDLKWESTTTYNVALDFGFFNNRISGSLDVYQRRTKDLFSYVQIPAGSNLSNYLTVNVGDMKNSGVDFTLNARPYVSQDLNWNFGLNLGYNKNEITKLNAQNNDDAYVSVGDISGGTGNKIQIQKVGYPANSFFVFEQVYGSNGMPLEGLYVDRSSLGGTVTGNEKNKYIYKQPAPDVTIGVTNTVSYKSWDLFFSGRVYLGNYVYNNVASSNANYANVYNQSGYFNNLPRAVSKTNFKTSQLWSDFYVENGSFFRMDNISLGYNFKKLVTEKVSGRINFSVQNAFVITKYSGLDPEVASGIDNGVYPKPRVFTLGLSLNLK